MSLYAAKHFIILTNKHTDAPASDWKRQAQGKARQEHNGTMSVYMCMLYVYMTKTNTANSLRTQIGVKTKQNGRQR